MANNRIRFSNDFILKDEKVGINTTEPRAQLDVGGDLYISGEIESGKGIKIVGILTAGSLDIQGHSELDNVNVSGILTTTSLNVEGNSELDNVNVSGISTLTQLHIGIGGTILNTTLDSNVGIGTTNASQKLEVVGNGKFTGIVTASQFSTGNIGSAINITANQITGPNQIIIDPQIVGDNTGNVRIKGDLYVDGEQFVVNSSTIELADLRVGIATTVGTNELLDGGGIGIGSTNILKTITWNNSASAWTSSEDWNLASGKQYEINGTSVLNSTTLGSGVTNSSLTSVGTLEQLNVSGVSTVSDLYVNGALYDSSNSRGNLNEVLFSVGAGLGVTWKSLTSGEIAGAVEVKSSSPSTPYYIIGVEDSTGITTSFYTDTDVVLTGDGRLGIGTTNPREKLEVIGIVSATGFFGDGIFTENLSVSGVSTFLSSVGIGTIIDIVPYDNLNNGTIAIEGSAGQLFSISNNLTSGSIFSVNDVSGIPSIDVNADGTILLAPFGATEYIGVGKTNPTEKLDVVGNTLVSGNLGIGTTNAREKLDVVGDALINDLTVGKGGGDVSTNTVLGYQALESNTTGSDNVATGYQALRFNTIGGANVATGSYALYSNTTGSGNVANGTYALIFNTTGVSNVANGYEALRSNTTGINNVANGYEALRSNTTGNNNVANGYQALNSNTTGGANVATGSYALYSNTTGNFNVATGHEALRSNTTASNNTATGYQALNSNTTGNSNVANGYQALNSNTTGSNNVANGYQALYSNTTAINNVANGYQALYSNTTGTGNVATGIVALYSNTIGSNNVATGYLALLSNTTGANNVANGYGALNSNTTGNNNVATGYNALRSNTTGYYNVANGSQTLNGNTTGYGNVAIGYAALTSNITGVFNVANGYQALILNTTGNNNTANGSQALYSNTTGNNNVANGYNALFSNTTGVQNVATGLQALYYNTIGGNNVANGYNALLSNTTGNGNVANGYTALFSNTTGSNNVATGFQALYYNTTGGNNVANGFGALFSNTTGFYNVATGHQALNSNTTGGNNIATGYRALYSNTTGVSNVANGYGALNSNTTGNNNTANGFTALFSNTTGTNNTATGYNALRSNTTGNSNVATGYEALYSNTTGGNNVANGREALYSNTTGTNNIANGYRALYSNTTGFYNVSTGYAALFSNTTGSQNVANGYQALYSNTTGNFNSHYGTFTGISTTASRRIVIGSGTNLSNLFDTPDTTKDTQLAIGHNVSGTSSYWIVGDENYNIGIGTTAPQYKLHVVGDFGATTKSFVIPHPTKPGMTLRHGSLEGPENGVYVRGKTTESIIPLPDYWTGLVDEDTITVNLTPKNRKLHSVVGISSNTVEIECVDGEVDCYFMILGERKDVAKLEVEY